MHFSVESAKKTTRTPVCRTVDRRFRVQKSALCVWTGADGRRAAVVCSFSDRARTVKLPFAVGEVLLASHGEVALSRRSDGDVLTLQPYQGVVVET